MDSKNPSILLRHHSLILMLILTFCILISLIGCASFHYTNDHSVPDGTARIVNVDSRIIEYEPLEIISAPTESVPVLKIVFHKKISEEIKYETRMHKEKVFVKHPTRFETNFPSIAVVAGAGALCSLALDKPEILSLAGLYAVFYLIKTPKPSEKIKYDPIPGSNYIDITSEKKIKTNIAEGETLIMDNSILTKTDNNGIAIFNIRNLADFNNGIVIRHIPANDKYLIRRIPKERTIQRDWAASVKKLELGVEAAEVIKNSVAAVAETINPEILITEIVLGVVIHILIEKLGTYSEQYYEWIIVSTQ